MQIPSGLYPDFSTITTLEALTLKLARTILLVQKNPLYNSGVQDIISIVGDEEAENVTVTCENWEASLVDGELKVKNYFPTHPFTAGTGDYPFNRENLCDALFHCVIFQQLQELNLQRNPGDGNQYISFSASSADAKGRNLNFDISFSLDNIPTMLVDTTDGTTSKARPYLQN
ncbi:MAG: hypothetical protein ACKPEN_09620 [Planktothrix sp.]|uniref:hypothetical protein n=1 Tax=Planktothrix sp. TaxID=3088171 RepID=UPI0038D419E6